MLLRATMNLPTSSRTTSRQTEGASTSAEQLTLKKSFPPLTSYTVRGSCVKHVIESDAVYCYQKRINKGGFSEVWLAKHNHGFKEEPVAIKLLSKSTCPVHVILNEAEILRTVQQSPFLVQMISCFQTATHYGIVTKFATRGTLHERVKVVRCFSELVARFYAVEIAVGLFVLHNMGIIHRDLNLDNVLVCENGHVVLSDFGLSVHLSQEDMDRPCEPWLDGPGKPQFPAPELFLGAKYDKTVDWWAFGVILYRMVCGGFPFIRSKKMFRESRAYNLQMVYRPEIYPLYLSPPAKQLISRLLHRRREKRLGSGKVEELDVTSLPFFHHVDWCKVRDLSMPAPFSDLVDSHAVHKHKGKQLVNLALSYLGSMDAVDVEMVFDTQIAALKKSGSLDHPHHPHVSASKDSLLSRLATWLVKPLRFRRRVYSH